MVELRRGRGCHLGSTWTFLVFQLLITSLLYAGRSILQISNCISTPSQEQAQTQISKTDNSEATPVLRHDIGGEKERMPQLPQSLPLQDYKRLWGNNSIVGGKHLERFWTMDTLKNAIPVPATRQMRPVFDKLYSGKPLTVLAIGSSVTLDMGGCFQSSVDDVYKLVQFPQPFLYGMRDGISTGWLDLFMRYINHTFPHQNHIAINAARAATAPAEYANSMCLHSMIPKQTDIVIIETMGTWDVVALEQLTWRLLRHFKKHGGPTPAIIVFNPTFVAPRESKWGGLEPGGSKPPCRETQPGEDYTACCATWESAFTAEAWDTRRNGGEAAHNELTRYLGFAAISHRNFLYQHILDKTWEQLQLPHGECELVAMVNYDKIHPSVLGRVLIADYLWTYFSLAHDAYLADKQQYDGSRIQEYNRNYPSKPFSPTGRNIYDMDCYGFVGVEGNMGSIEAARGRPQNIENLPVIGGTGFNFSLHTVEADPKKLKPGWVAKIPGSWIDVKVSTVFKQTEGHWASGVTNSAAKPQIVVLYLASYEHIGSASVTCISGCQCAETIIDGYHTERTSVSKSQVVETTESLECVIRIKVLDATKTGEHKFQVNQIVTRKLIS